jgi:phosphoglycerate dehydrogenase-like enzyme
MKLLILLYHRFELWQVPAWFVEKLHQEFPALEVSRRNTYDDVAQFLQGAEIVFTLSLRPDQFKAAPRLKWIHCPAAAVHQLIYPELVNSDVVLTNGSQIHGPVVAEHVIALILALSKDLHLAARFQQRHVWGQEEIWNARPRPREVAGATLGLVGLGSIGRDVAKHASALGMKVIATRHDPAKPIPEGVSEVLPADQINSLLARSDYIVLAAPVTAGTERLINRERLLQMKPDACLINVGRGQLVDEAALADALRERRIGGAALDVFEQEPLPKDSPLWDLDNVLITPHTGGLSAKLWERQYDLFSENLRRYLAGRSLLAVVDKQRGY